MCLTILLKSVITRFTLFSWPFFLVFSHEVWNRNIGQRLVKYPAKPVSKNVLQKNLMEPFCINSSWFIAANYFFLKNSIIDFWQGPKYGYVIYFQTLINVFIFRCYLLGQYYLTTIPAGARHIVVKEVGRVFNYIGKWRKNFYFG